MPAAPRRLVAALLLGLAGTGAARAADAPAAPPPGHEAFLAALCGEGGRAIPQAVQAMLVALPAASPAQRDWVARMATAFGARMLRCEGDAAFLVTPAGTLDATTLSPAALPDDARTPFPSLRSRGALDQMLAGLALFGPAGAERQLAAVATLAAHADILPRGFADAARPHAADASVAAALQSLAVASGLHAPDPQDRIAALRALGAQGTERAVSELAALDAQTGYASDPAVAAALTAAQRQARLWQRAATALALLYNGLSVGSVLFLAAIGLAITFGLMGVINLAQGEFITVGAYATWCVQQALAAWAPGWLAWYPLLAVPASFAAAAATGVLVEVLVVRHLYRRPLMTLLATWAVSLLLTNLIRVGFGTQNLRFATPPWLVGGAPVLGDFLVTWNHLVAIGVACAAFGVTVALLRLTNLGLSIRAVAQNRAMAGCVGVSTRRTDMLAFGFGAGLAGLGGLALSPIYNVNPTMGSGFIIDSFMVVVLGGVGSLAGTALAAVGIGLVNVGIEPFYGAVAAKVIALLLIIALIQWRPEGLVAARGRR